MQRIMLLLAVGFLLWLCPSCKKDPFHLMVGEWRISHLDLPAGMNRNQIKAAQELPGNSYIVYKADSTYHAQMLKIVVEGKWHLDSNNTVLMTEAKDGRKAKMKILALTNDSVRLHNIAGDLDYTMTMVPYTVNGKRK